MWSGSGMKADHCPCCEKCENCPGFQKVLDVQEAGFVLYRHTTLVEDIDKKPGATKVTTNISDDVYILENTQGVPLQNVDFNTELDRNPISCPRCVNIIKHAQRLLKNQELGASDLIGVCAYCRQKSQTEKICLKCNEIVEQFQLNKATAKKSSHAQKIKTWLSKIQMLIQKTLVDDKVKKQTSSIKRGYSDIDINRILRKISKSDHEPEIADLCLPKIDSSNMGALSDRSYYPRAKEDKDGILHKTGISRDRRHHSTPYEEESRVRIHVPGKDYEDSLLQSTTTLTEDEFLRRYGTIPNLEIEDNKVYEYIDLSRLTRDHSSEERVHFTRHDDNKKDLPADKQHEHEKQKQFHPEDDTFQDSRTKKELVATESKYYESLRKRNLIEKSFSYEESRNMDYESSRKKVFDDSLHGDIRSKESILVDKKRYLAKDEVISGEKRRDYGPISNKHYDSDEKKVLPKSDSDFNNSRKTESVLATSKYYDSDRKKDWPKVDTVSDHKKVRESDETASKYYSDGKKDLPITDSASDDRRKKELVTTASKYYDGDKKIVGVPMTDKYYDRDRDKDFQKAELTSDDRRKTESVARDSKYYDSDKQRDILKADAVSDDRKYRETVPTGSKYYDSVREKDSRKAASVADDMKKREAVPTDSKYYDRDRNNESQKIDSVSDDRKRKESVTTAGKYYDSDKNKDILKADTVSDDRKKREAIAAASKYDDSDRKKDSQKTDSVSHDRRRIPESVTDSNYYDEDKKRDIRKAGTVSDDRKMGEVVLTASKYEESDRKKISAKADTFSDDRRERVSAVMPSKYYDTETKKEAVDHQYYENDKKRELLGVDGMSDDPKRKKYISKPDKHEDELMKRISDFDTLPDAKRKKEDALKREGDSSKIDHFAGRRKDHASEDDEKNYEEEKRKHFVLKTGIHHEEVKKRFTSEGDTYFDDKQKNKTMVSTKAHDGRPKPPVLKEYEGERGQGFIARIGKSFDDRYKQEFGEKVATPFKDSRRLTKIFIPLAVRRYTQDVSALLQPVLGGLRDKKSIKSKTGKGVYESASRIRKYRSDESLLTGITNLKDTSEELVGFDFYFPQSEREAKKKIARAKIVSSSELIKDTIDKLAEEKKKREEAERLKEEQRKQFDAERKERELAKKIEKDLEKQLKEREKETVLTLKTQANMQKGFGNDVDAKVKDVDKDDDFGKTKKTRSIQDQISSKEAPKGKEIKAVQSTSIAKIKEDKRKVKDETGRVKDEAGKIVEEKGKAKEDKGKVKEETGKVKEEIGKDKGKVKDGPGKSEKGRVKDETQNVIDEKINEVDTTDKNKGETFKEIQSKQKKEEKVKSTKEAIGDKDKEKKTKDDIIDKGKPKPERELPDTNKKSEQTERERMKDELKQQKEEERRKKADDDKAAESANQPKEKKKEKEKNTETDKKVISDQDESGKKGKEKGDDTVKTEDVSDTKEKNTVAPDKTKDQAGMKIPKRLSIYDLVVAKDRPKERQNIKQVTIPIIEIKKRRVLKDEPTVRNLSDLELDLECLLKNRQEEMDMKKNVNEAVLGDKIHKFVSHVSKTKIKEETFRELYRSKVEEIREQRNKEKMQEEKTEQSHSIDLMKDKIDITEVEPIPEVKLEKMPEPKPEPVPKSRPTKANNDLPGTNIFDPDYGKGVVRYTLSDRSFIEKGWTMLPTEKVVRKMNVYRMRPSHPEFDWFERNKKKGVLEYDTGEKLAHFDDNGRGRLYYRSGNLALDYYNAEEVNAQQRFVIYSSGEPDERGRTPPRTVLATFDYLGNGIVFDHAGKIRLKYNQTEGVILDRSLGPVSHWKWHTLNDPPVLQQVMIDTQMAHKDPDIYKLGGPGENKPRPDDEQMLAIEFDNFIKEKSAKLTQTFKPFQIKMKALKINEYFSLRVLDQATVYLIYRDGSKIVKLNIGMILDHKEIVDTDTAEVGEVSNNLERLPARTDSLAELQRSVAIAQKIERSRSERDRRIRRPDPKLSADQLTAAASRPLKPPLRTVDSSSTVAPNNMFCKCRKPTSSNIYYDTSLI